MRASFFYCWCFLTLLIMYVAISFVCSSANNSQYNRLAPKRYTPNTWIKKKNDRNGIINDRMVKIPITGNAIIQRFTLYFTTCSVILVTVNSSFTCSTISCFTSFVSILHFAPFEITASSLHPYVFISPYSMQIDVLMIPIDKKRHWELSSVFLRVH